MTKSFTASSLVAQEVQKRRQVCSLSGLHWKMCIRDRFKIHPFTYFEAKEMLSSYTNEEQAVLYGVTGGIPEYLSRIRKEKTVDENIINLFFDESGRLFDEPSNLLKQEVRDPATYHSIISAIAGGASRLSLIHIFMVETRHGVWIPL